MKLRKLICLGLVCLLLTACGGAVRQEDLMLPVVLGALFASAVFIFLNARRKKK